MIEVFNQRSEAKVISYMCLSHDACDRFSQTLTVTHFVDEFHREIFRVLKAAWINDRDCFDAAALVLRQLAGKFKTCAADLYRLINDYRVGLRSISEWRYHEKELHEAFVSRGVQWVGSELLKVENSSDPMTFYRKTIDDFEKTTKLIDVEIPDFQSQAFEFLENIKEGKTPQQLTTGNHIWDDLGILRYGCNAVLAGLPGTGKTALGIQTCVTGVLRGLSVAYFSFEMSVDELMMRVLMNGIRCTKDEVPEKIKEASELIGKLDSKLFLFATAGCRVHDIDVKIRTLQKQFKIDIAVVDHMGLVKADRAGSPYEQRSQVSSDLRIMAAQTNVALINMCQLNRSVGNDEPRMNSLRDSGKIEEDATSISFLHNSSDSANDEIALIIRKNRHGEIGTFKNLRFRREFQTFESSDSW